MCSPSFLVAMSLVAAMNVMIVGVVLILRVAGALASDPAGGRSHPIRTCFRPRLRSTPRWSRQLVTEVISGRSDRARSRR